MSATNQYTILIVEDENPLLQAIKIKLQKSNFNVLTARTHSQAMGYLEDVGHVDGVWLDHYLLGTETGIDFITELKKKPKWNAIPVFVVSNSGSPDKMQEYLRQGAVKFYIKSDHRLDEIIADIKQYLTEHSTD